MNVDTHARIVDRAYLAELQKLLGLAPEPPTADCRLAWANQPLFPGRPSAQPHGDSGRAIKVPAGAAIA